MASRVALNNMKNFPVVTAKLSEGAVTRADVVGPDGGVIEGALSRAAPIVKGNFVRLVTTSTDKEQVVVEKAAPANEANVIIGVVVSSPAGEDATTVSGQAAAVAQMRTADVAILAQGIIEVEVNGATKPGDALGISESEQDVFGPFSSPGVLNGELIALRYGVDGEKVPAAVGYAGFLPAD